MKKKDKSVLTWKPVRRGPFYCSTACGAKCTHAEYEAAKAAAEACRARMKSKGWKICVNENMGWFWSIHKTTKNGATLSVRGGQMRYGDDPTKDFYAMLSMTMPGACDGAWHDDKRFDDPNDAVTHRLRLARRYLSVKNAAVDELTFGAELKHGSKSAPQRLAAIQRILEAASNRASKSLKHGALLVHEVTERDLKRIFVLTISTNGTRKTKARR